MADEIGISVRTLNRSIKKLEQDGLIRIQKGKVTVSEKGFLHMQKNLDDYLNGYSETHHRT